ncbi:hypothetical protein ACFXTO_036585 [Malus domestica]
MAPEGWEPADRWGYRVEYKQEQLVAANEIDPGYAALLSHDILMEENGGGLLKAGEVEELVSCVMLTTPCRRPRKGKVTLIKSQDWTTDFGKVFDVILEEAMNANLKPDKMVKKVLALPNKIVILYE